MQSSKMIRGNLGRLNLMKRIESFGPFIHVPCRSKLTATIPGERSPAIQSNEQQASYYTAKDVEFCPNRAKDVMQNYVQETSDACDGKTEEEPRTDSATQNDKDHMEGYQPGPSVSLYSVMQSNVPEPFSSQEVSPTHLNMPGSSNTHDYKYLSGKMQNVHQSEH